MSTKAEVILDQLKTLPRDEQQAVLDALRQRDVRQLAWEDQAATLRGMQARHAGRGLLTRLLEERAKERARG